MNNNDVIDEENLEDTTSLSHVDSTNLPLREIESFQEKCECDEVAELNKNSEENISTEQAKDYRTIVKKKRGTLFLKRLFDIIVSFMGIGILLPLFIIIGIIILFSGKGGVFFRQKRIGRNRKPFTIIKFRTMVENAQSQGMQITVGADVRITKIGKFLRKTKIDELPQLFNVFLGQMSVVGPRPEVAKFVELYNDEQLNVLLVRPGITELASIVYRDESEVLAKAEDPHKTYIEEVMPRKLELNLGYIEKMNMFYDLKLILQTFIAIIK